MADLHVLCKATIGSLPMDAQFTAAAPWTVLFGPSGSGKSSLLRLIAGLWRPQHASVHLGSENVTHTAPFQRRITLVGQQPALFPHMDARQNIAFAVPSHAAPERRRVADELLEQFRASHVATQRPHSLSGGEIQRVALARAVASAPRLLLLDEVFTGLDRTLADELQVTLRAWQRNTGSPILSVTHDVQEALAADEVIRVDRGQVIAQGHPGQTLHDEREGLLRQLTVQEKL